MASVNSTPYTGVNEASNPLEPGQNSYFSDCINNGSQMVPMMTKKKPGNPIMTNMFLVIYSKAFKSLWALKINYTLKTSFSDIHLF